MAGRRPAARMQLVEVDESPAQPGVPAPGPTTGDSVAGAADPGGTGRRPVLGLLRRWWPAGVVAVVAVVVVILVGVARDRTFVERVAAVPGLVRPLDGAPSVLWRAPAAAHDGAVVAADDAIVLVSVQAGRWWLTAHAPADGAVRWSRELALVQLAGFEGASLRCPSTGEDVGSTVLCLLTMPQVVYGDEASPPAPARTRVLALDATDGADLGSWEVADEVLTADRVGDDLVVATVDGAGRVVVARHAGRTGAVAWTYRTPEVLDSPVLSRTAEAWTAGGVVVVEGVVTHVLDVDDGTELATSAVYRDLQVVPLPDGFATWASVGGGQVHEPDGTVRFSVAGLPARLLVDDGTARDVLVVDDGGSLRGVSSTTGEPSWTTQTMLDARIRVSDRLLLSGPTRYGVLDPGTGRLLWMSDAGDPLPWMPATDGALVLAPVVAPDGGAQLAGLGLDDGVRFWAVDLPPDVRVVEGVDGRLVVRTELEALVLG